MSRFTFGKYKNEHICDVPTNYLKWVEENMIGLDPHVRREINHEINRREGEQSSLGFIKPNIKLPEPK